MNKKKFTNFILFRNISVTFLFSKQIFVGLNLNRKQNRKLDALIQKMDKKLIRRGLSIALPGPRPARTPCAAQQLSWPALSAQKAQLCSGGLGFESQPSAEIRRPSAVLARTKLHTAPLDETLGHFPRFSLAVSFVSVPRELRPGRRQRRRAPPRRARLLFFPFSSNHGDREKE